MTYAVTRARVPSTGELSMVGNNWRRSTAPMAEIVTMTLRTQLGACLVALVLLTLSAFLALQIAREKGYAYSGCSAAGGRFFERAGDPSLSSAVGWVMRTSASQSARASRRSTNTAR
jgi:hypothetical protein